MKTAFKENIKTKVGDFLHEIFSGEDGRLSSKRIIGTIGFIGAIVLICFRIDNDTLRTLIIVSASLLGLGTFENIKFFK